MVETQKHYGIIKASPKFLVRDLLLVPHKNGKLVVGYPAFGPGTYSNNLAEMQKTHTHSDKYPKLSFRAPTTSESISPSAYDFENLAKPQIFNPRWLQAGRIVKTNEGVFTNTTETDERKLKALLDKAKKVNGIGIYFGENDFGFAPYGTFEQGIQEAGKFVEGGLARILEHTKGPAENLRAMASTYKKGVNVFGFDSVKEPVLKVVSLGSSSNLDGGRLSVYGDDCDNYGDGYAFGVL